ncbi:MAG TPA: glutamate racemase [Sphingobacteriaceae bacterium]
MSSSLPVGIFDSGIGGLTVAGSIHQLLPGEQLIYFGDTAHLPYGDKSPEAIKYYSLKIARLLLEKKCKLIVIACNTASSYAYDDVVQFLGEHVPIVNVIDPVVERVVTRDAYRKIGVIGTKATIRSNIYPEKLKASNPALQVASLATPLLAPMIEEGFFNNNISSTLIHSYLSSGKLKGIDSLILACTHYPLIKEEVDAFYGGKVDIVNTADIVAEYVRKKLEVSGLLNDGQPGRHQFYVSDYTTSFEKSTRIFFGEKIHLKLNNIWD